MSLPVTVERRRGLGVNVPLMVTDHGPGNLEELTRRRDEALDLVMELNDQIAHLSSLVQIAQRMRTRKTENGDGAG